MNKETYRMWFNCWNCGHQFYKNLPKETPAQTNGGKCPNCGMRDGYLISNCYHYHKLEFDPE